MKTPAPIVQSQRPTQIEDDIQSVIFDNEPNNQPNDQDDLPAGHFESDEELPPMPPSLDMSEITSVFGENKANDLLQTQIRNETASVFSTFDNCLSDITDLNESNLRDDLLDRCFDTKVNTG